MPPKGAAAARGRSASAAPVDNVNNNDNKGDSSTATPARRGKRRLSEQQPPVEASTRTLRTRAKTPILEEEDDNAGTTPARKRKSTPSVVPQSATKRARRVSAVPKPLKVGINPLPEPYPVFSAIPAFSFPYTLPKEYDPRNAQVSRPALTVLAAGDGTFGVLGLGEEVDRLSKFKRHKWFHDAITQVTASANGSGDDVKMEGTDAEESSSKAEPKLAKDGIVEIVCGGMHTLALDADGQVWSWGINDNGVLGRVTEGVEGKDSDELESQPMLVQGLEGFKAVRIAAGDGVSLAISDRGEVRSWGCFRNQNGLIGFHSVPGQPKVQIQPVSLPNLDKHAAVQVVSGENHVLVLTSEGHVYSHGTSERCQLGRRVVERRQLNGLAPERLALRNIVHVAAGTHHSFAVDKSGKVYAWGNNSHMQLGIPTAEGGMTGVVPLPTPVEALNPANHNGAKVVQIASALHHSVFLFDNGQVFVCGSCDDADSGFAADHPDQDNHCIPVPTRLPIGGEAGQEEKIVKVACGLRHSFAITDQGKLYGWGLNGGEQLGIPHENDDDEDREAIRPPRVVPLPQNKEVSFGVLAASSGGSHSILLAARIVKEDD